MKKEDVTGIFAYLLIIALAIIFGFTILRNHAPESQMGNLYYLFVAGAVVAGLLLNAIMFEVAHVIGAKIGRYLVLSISILGVTLINQGEDTKLKFKGFEGLTGETKILPDPNASKPCNPKPFLLAGTIWFGFEIIVALILFYTLNATKNVSASNAAYFILTVAIIGGMIFIYNILPIRLDVITDGYRLRMVSNPKNKEAFNELLRVQHAIDEGQKDIEIKTFTEITDFTADLNLNKVYLLLDKKQYKEAEELIDITLAAEGGVSAKTYLRARAQKIYINIMTKPIEEAKEFYENNVPQSERRAISEDISMPSIRAYLLMSGLLDKSRSECIIALNNIYKAYKKTPVNRRPIEMELFNEALEKVDAVHKDWELMDYKLVDSKKEKQKEENENKDEEDK